MDSYFKIGIISKCNLNCRFCSTAGKSDELSLEEIKELILNAIKQRKVPMITGGEPLLHPNFFDILSFMKENHIRGVVESNGLLLLDSNIYDRLKPFLKDFITFDFLINGFNSNLHDYLSGKEGSFFGLLKILERFQSDSIPFNLHVVINKVNYRYLPNIASLALRFNAQQIRFIFILPLGNADKYFEELIPFLSLVRPYLYSVLKKLLFEDIRVYFENIPYCVIPYFEKYIQSFDLTFKTKKDEKFCSICAFDLICDGFYEWYLLRKADDEFVSISPYREKLTTKLRLTQDAHPFLDNYFLVQSSFDPNVRPI
ncbi:MAG: radical SAM protein [Candidatus Woesearchaeota archaeon]